MSAKNAVDSGVDRTVKEFENNPPTDAWAPFAKTALTALKSQKARAAAAYEKSEAYEELLYAECARLLAEQCRTFRKEDAQSLFSPVLNGSNPLPRPHLLALAFEKALEQKFGTVPPPDGFSQKKELRPRICYMKNRFLQRVADLSGVDADWFYAGSFREACEEVTAGEREGCLLPYLDGEGRPLPGIARLISEYGLKKRKLFLLEMEEQFSGYLFLFPTLLPDRHAQVLEVELFPENQRKLTEALSLCDALGVNHSLPLPILQREDEENRSLSSVVKIYGGFKTLMRVLFCISLLIPDAAATGFYEIRKLKAESLEQR